MLKSLCATLLLALGAASPLEAAVAVSSKLSSESAMLGQMIRLLLIAQGIPTVDRTRVGATPVVRFRVDGFGRGCGGFMWCRHHKAGHHRKSCLTRRATTDNVRRESCT